MKEEFLHFLWKYRLYDNTHLRTTQGERAEILNPGTHNTNSGPDFFAGQVKIDGTLWVGNIEMHLRSSDWYRHGHQDDPAYANTILHVVMIHDRDICDKHQNVIPVVELSSFFDTALLGIYKNIMSSKSWVPCQSYIADTNYLVMLNWLNRLLVERIERRSKETSKIMEYFQEDWEQTFYYFLACNFGFNINAEPMGLLAKKTPWKILSRHRDDLLQVEALLFGQAGMLCHDYNDAYPMLLKKEYDFLKHKYNLSPLDGSIWKNARLRPANFPAIRLAQFAQVIHLGKPLFMMIAEETSTDTIFQTFNVSGSPYWKNHYQFDKLSVSKAKRMGDAAIENIIINTLAPIKFIYGKLQSKPALQEEALVLLSQLKPEKNQIIDLWTKTGIKPLNAGESQALLELKKHYCTPKKCLDCAIGHNLIKSNKSFRESWPAIFERSL